MPKFDFRAFLENNGIEYIDHGPQVTRGNIGIQCPFCGDADPSYHMGINVTTNYWNCWRNSYHRGKSPARLVAKLLGCTVLRAKTIVSEESTTDVSAFDEMYLRLNQPPKEKEKPPEPPTRLNFVNGMRKVSRRGYGELFYKYIRDRGFTKSQTDWVIKEHKLKYSLTGTWRWRLIIPIYFNGKLVNWTGRSIRKDATVRYLSLSTAPSEDSPSDMPQAVMSVKHCLFNFDSIYRTGGRRLYVMEGPFDAIKFDTQLRLFDIRATCLFGTSLSLEQRYLLFELAEQFDDVVVVVDPESEHIAIQIASDLASVDAGIEIIPQEYEDPGAMTGDAIQEFARVS